MHMGMGMSGMGDSYVRCGYEEDGVYEGEQGMGMGMGMGVPWAPGSQAGVDTALGGAGSAGGRAGCWLAGGGLWTWCCSSWSMM